MENEILRTDDLELSELDNFSGAENYYGVMGVNCTDGVEYIIRNGYSWFVTDFLVMAKMDAKLKAEEFLSIKLKLDGNKARMIVTDGNNKELYTQDYDWTNCKKEVSLYLTNNVLMLTGEY